MVAISLLQTLRALVNIEHWKTVAEPARWLQKPTPLPESFESPAQAEAYWRRWGKLANDDTVGIAYGRSIQELCRLIFPSQYTTLIKAFLRRGWPVQ